MFCTHIWIFNNISKITGNSRREKGREYARARFSFILTDNPPPPSSSVDNSSRDACNREEREK